jgi:hypothetical protein
MSRNRSDATGAAAFATMSNRSELTQSGPAIRYAFTRYAHSMQSLTLPYRTVTPDGFVVTA